MQKILKLTIIFLEPVTFDILSRNLTAKLGQHVTIECQAKGDDPIRIMWTRNGKPINPLTQRLVYLNNINRLELK